MTSYIFPPAPDPSCTKCEGTGIYFYDHNHGTICDACCPCDQGWWLLGKGYSNAGNYACKRGCGTIKTPQELGIEPLPKFVPPPPQQEGDWG